MFEAWRRLHTPLMIFIAFCRRTIHIERVTPFKANNLRGSRCGVVNSGRVVRTSGSSNAYLIRTAIPALPEIGTSPPKPSGRFPPHTRVLMRRRVCLARLLHHFPQMSSTACQFICFLKLLWTKDAEVLTAGSPAHASPLNTPSHGLPSTRCLTT